MWQDMVARGDGVLRLPEKSIDLGHVLCSAPMPSLPAIPRPRMSSAIVPHLKLATVGETGEPARRRATRSKISDAQWRLVSELTDHPYRLLVIATPKVGEALAKVAHENNFRRWTSCANRSRPSANSSPGGAVWSPLAARGRRPGGKAPRS